MLTPASRVRISRQSLTARVLLIASSVACAPARSWKPSARSCFATSRLNRQIGLKPGPSLRSRRKRKAWGVSPRYQATNQIIEPAKRAIDLGITNWLISIKPIGQAVSLLVRWLMRASMLAGAPTSIRKRSGSILFRKVKIEPAEKGRSLKSRPNWP
jgi:hypothetical protein